MKRNTTVLASAVCALLALRADWRFLRAVAAVGPARVFAAPWAPRFFWNALWPAAGAAVCVAIAWRFGEGALGLEAGRERAQEDPAVAFCLGVGGYASCLFLLGLAGELTPSFAAALSLAFAAGAALLPRSKALGGPSAAPGDGGLLRPLLLGLLLYAAWHGLIQALAPPTDLDVLAYHLPLPKLYAQSARVMEVPWLLHSHWPHLINVLYTVAFFLRSDLVAALLDFAASAALVWSVFQAARLWFDETTAWVSAALLAAQPVFLRFAGTARVDSWWALFHFLACVSAWRWRLTGRRGWLVRAGLLAGLAASTKLMGIATAAALVVFVAAQTERGFPGRRALSVGTLAGCALLPALPWYLKTWLGAGDPAWPFFTGIFGDRWGAADFLAGYQRSNHWDLSSLFRYDALYFIVPFLGLLLAAAARSDRARYFPPVLLFFLAASLPYGFLVLGHFDAWRLILPAWPALALAAGWWATRLAREKGPGLRAAAAALAAAFLPLAGLSQNNQLFAVLQVPSAAFPALSPREAYLRRSLEPYSFVQEAGRLLKNVPCKVLLFPATIGYYFDADYQWGDADYQGLIPYDRLSGPEDLARRLRALGVTHVLVNEAWFNPRDRRASSLMLETLRSQGTILSREGALSLYSLGASNVSR